MCTRNATFALYVLATAALAVAGNIQQSIKNRRLFLATDLVDWICNLPMKNEPSLENTITKNGHPASTPIMVPLPWHDAVCHSVAMGLNSTNSKSTFLPAIERPPLKKEQAILPWFLHFEHDETTRPRVFDSTIQCNNMRCKLCQNQSMETMKTTLPKMFQLSRQDFVTDQEKKSIGTGQSSTLDDPTCIPVAHDSTMGRNDCCMCVYYNKFKFGSCKTSIKLMGEISIAMNRQEFNVVVRESKEKKSQCLGIINRFACRQPAMARCNHCYDSNWY